MHRTPGTAQDDEKVISWTGLRHVSNARVQELDTGRTFRIMTRTGSMNTLKTLTFAATTALAVATFTLPGAQAQTAKQMQEPQGGSGYGRMLGEPDRAALLDARIAGIRAGLNLTEEQDALFGPVEDAYRAMAESRRERMQDRAGEQGRGSMRSETRGEMRGGMPEGARGEMRDRNRQERAEHRDEMRARMGAGRTAQGDFMENLERRAADMTTRAAHLGDFTEAMRPFWDSLDEDQRRLAPVLMHPRLGVGMGRGMGMSRGMGQQSRMGEGPGGRHGHHGGRYGAPR